MSVHPQGKTPLKSKTPTRDVSRKRPSPNRSTPEAVRREAIGKGRPSPWRPVYPNHLCSRAAKLRWKVGL